MRLSYANGPSSTPLLGQTIDENLRQTVARFGDRDAVVDVAGGHRLTYAQFDEAVQQVAKALISRGIAVGDRVGIWAPNCLEWQLVQYATARVGAILVTINPSYRTHELAYVLRQAAVRTVVAAPSFKTSDYRSMIAQVRPDLPDLTDVVLFGEPSWQELLAAAADVADETVSQRSAQLSFD